MFVTYKQAEIPIGMHFGDEDTKHWQYVEQTLHCPWFYVTLARQNGGEIMLSMLLIPNTLAFEQLLEEQGNDIWLKEVQLVSPGYMNASDRWGMERLLEIQEIVDSADDSCTYVYRLERGHSYSERQQIGHLSRSSSRVIFSAVKHIRS